MHTDRTLNSLTPPQWSRHLSQPALRWDDEGQNDKQKVSVSKGENEWSRHQRLFEENVRKTKKRSVNFENKDSGVVYT